MNTVVRSFLIELARHRTNQTIHYQELSDACSLGLNMRENPSDRKTIGVILGDISRFENGHERPLLSSLVIRTSDNYEGDGFYKLADELGFGGWQRLKREGIFEIQQMKQTIDFWRDATNYTLHR